MMTLLMMAGESNAQEEEFWAEEVVLSRDDDDEGEESEDEDWEDEEEEDVDREELDSILTALEDGDYTEEEELSDDGGCWLVIPDDGFDPVAFMCQGDDATRSAVSIRKTITVNGYTFTYDASSEDWDTNEVDAFDADGEVRDWLTDNVDVAPPSNRTRTFLRRPIQMRNPSWPIWTTVSSITRMKGWCMRMRGTRRRRTRTKSLRFQKRLGRLRSKKPHRLFAKAELPAPITTND